MRAFNAMTTFEASLSASKFRRDISFPNYKTFCIAKAYAISEFGNEMTC